MTTARLQGPPGWAEIARAVPAGSAPLRSMQVERRYLDALVEFEPWRELREDARLVTLAVAKWLARHASWSDGTTRPGRQLVRRLVGAVRGDGPDLSVTAFKEARRRLERWGFLGTVREGTTERFRPMALARRDGPDEAPVWVLCLPRKTAFRHEPASPRRTMRPPTWLMKSHRSPTRADPPREGQDRDGAGSAGAHSGAAAAAYARHGPGDAAAATAAALAGVMRAAAGQPISEGWVSWIARPFTAAGYSAGDLAYAIDHAPSGAAHGLTQPVRHAVGWLRYRLGLWLDAGGAALPSHRHVLESSRARTRAEVAAWRRQQEVMAASWTDPAPHAARIRAELGYPEPGQ